jgi:DNA-binding transcriptional MerR regulator
MRKPQRYTILELAQKTGVPPRTVRFYVQRDLIPPAVGRGRGQHYGEEHLTGILRLQDLKRSGRKLDDAKKEVPGRDRHELAESRDDAAAPTASTQRRVTRILLAHEGIWLEVGGGVILPTADGLDRLAEVCRREFGLNPEDRQRRITVINRLGSVLHIPDGLGKGSSLRIGPGESVEVADVTPAIQRAESDGLVTVLRQPE